MASSNFAESDQPTSLPSRYYYRLSADYQKQYEEHLQVNYQGVEVQRPKLKPTDRFNFRISVVSRSVDSNSVVHVTTLLHRKRQVGCKSFFQEGQHFLRSNLSHSDFPSESCEHLVQRLVPEVRQLFDFSESFDLVNGVGKPDDVGSSQSRQFTLFVRVVVDLI